MDGNFSNFSWGLGIEMARNENAGTDYDRLSETEKEHVILKCKDAKSKDEMEKIVDSYAGEGAGDLREDMRIS